MEGFPSGAGPWEDHQGGGARGRGSRQGAGRWVLGTETGLMNPGPQVRTLSAASGLLVNNRPHGAPTVGVVRPERPKRVTHLSGRPQLPSQAEHGPGTPGVSSSSLSQPAQPAVTKMQQMRVEGSSRFGGLEVRGQDVGIAEFRFMKADLAGPSSSRERLGP